MGRKPKSEPMRNSNAVDELREIVDTLVGLADEADILKDRASEVAARAKSRGFDVAAVKKIVKERREPASSKTKRDEVESAAEIYRAALGMLGGTPLGDAARERLSRDEVAPAGDDATREETDQATTITPDVLDAAREEGREACRAGTLVIDNPYTARDPRRAAWDEGWCFEAGSDGMDIPDAFRRQKPKKPAGDEDGEG